MIESARPIVIGVDAASMRAGGGVSYLVGLLGAADPDRDGFSRIVVWGGGKTLAAVGDRPWLTKMHEPALDRGLVHRARWQRTRLSMLAREAGCDVLFVPGGSFTGSFRPFVTISHNLLPFEWPELRRYGFSRMTLKLLLLRAVQGRTFRRADGLIFASAYAHYVVSRAVDISAVKTVLVPNGVDAEFFAAPRPQRPTGTPTAPLRLVYISIIEVYKHQWNVASAVAELRAAGVPVRLDLYGAASPGALGRLRSTLGSIENADSFITYHGRPPRGQLLEAYHAAEVFVYASSCENMPIIMLEAMASGVPIASSNRGPMPEVLGDAGVYFDPENPADIARCLREFISTPGQRERSARAAHDRAKSFTWDRCAADSLALIRSVSRAGRNAPVFQRSDS